MRLLFVVAVLGGVAALRPAPAPVGRRALLGGAAAAFVAQPFAAFAAGDLSDLNLDAPSAPVAMPVGDLDSGGAAPIQMITLGDAAAKKPRTDTPAARIKELEKLGGSATAKEKKELCAAPQHLVARARACGHTSLIASRARAPPNPRPRTPDRARRKRLKTEEMCELLGRGC